MLNSAASSRDPSKRGHFISRRSAIAVIVAASMSAPASAASLDQTFGTHAKGSAVTVDHGRWDSLVKAHVKPSPDGLNRVDYAGWKKNGHTELKAYLVELQKVDPSKLDRPEQFAFWANLYNAKTIDVVLDKYPVKSIKDVSLGGGLKALVTGGPWQAKVVKISGQDLSLDDIEHSIMRAVFKDPRVHYSVNCASVGCPNLPNMAFTGARLEEMLETGARAYVNHPRGIKVEAGKIKASSIYSWFVADFGGSADGVLAHVKKYAGAELAKQLEGVKSIADYAYDWALNDIKG